MDMKTQELPSIALSHQQPSLLEEVLFPDCGVVASAATVKADRFNEGKPELSYILDAPLAMKGLADRFAIGAKKYDRDNWKKGLSDVQIVDSLLRHLLAYQNGEVYDEDGGLHADAIVWNAVVLSEQHHRMLNKAKDKINNGKYA